MTARPADAAFVREVGGPWHALKPINPNFPHSVHTRCGVAMNSAHTRDKAIEFASAGHNVTERCGRLGCVKRDGTPTL